MGVVKNINLISGLIEKINKLTIVLETVSVLDDYESIVITDKKGVKKGVKLTNLGGKIFKDSLRNGLKKEIDIENLNLKNEIYGESSILTAIKNLRKGDSIWVVDRNAMVNYNDVLIPIAIEVLQYLSKDNSISIFYKIDNHDPDQVKWIENLDESIKPSKYNGVEYDIIIDRKSGFNPEVNWGEIKTLLTSMRDE